MRKFFLLLLFLGLSIQGFSQNYKLHSVFIFSFTRYVIWPEAYNKGDFEIMVLGETPLLEELKTMAQTKKVGDRSIKITQINSPAQIRKCNILFIPAAQSSSFAEVMGKVNTQSILVVTEDPGMGAKGSDINFITKDGKLAFELNQSAVQRQNLRVSNELSRLAILM